jgi:uncharacterized protein (UPF0335 family)
MTDAVPADYGHNAVPVSAERLRSYVVRIENLEEAKRDYANDIRAVYAEAKDAGIDVKAMRVVVKLRREDAEKRAERENAVDAIMHKLGMD